MAVLRNWVGVWSKAMGMASIVICVAAGVAAEEVAAPGPATSVEMHRGRPTFFLDGKPYTRPFFATYQPRKEIYAAMEKAGFEVHLFQVSLPGIWHGPDRWDFSYIDSCARDILEADPDALILPRIYLQAPPWWREAHPEELMVLDHGGTTFQEPYKRGIVTEGRTYESIASTRWREDGAEALRTIIRHIHASPWGDRIFGYQFSGLATEEWYHYTVNQDANMGDYSEPMRQAFARWLEDRYGSAEALAAAWNRPGIGFEDVTIPTREERLGDRNRTFRDPATQMNVIDFYRFHSFIVVDTINHFARAIKEATDRRKVVGTYYAYLFEFRGNPDFGHNAVGEILRSPDVDFILAPPGYLERMSGGMETYRRPFHSGTLHGKLWVNDNDSVSFQLDKVMAQHSWTEDQLAEMAMYHPEGGTTAQESLWNYQRSAGFVLSEGIYQSIFDLHGGYYDHPQLIQGLRRILDLHDRSKDVDRTSVAQVLIVADEASCAYMGFQMDRGGYPWDSGLGTALALYQPGFIRSGVPFDSILQEDLSRVDLEPYRLVVFLNAYHMDDILRAFVQTQVKRNGRSILWIYAPGLFNGNRASVDAMKTLADMGIDESADEAFVDTRFALTPEGRTWMESAGFEPIEGAIGPELRNCKLFSVSDPDAQPLGTHIESGAVVFASRDMGDWTSYYAVTAILPPALIRALARSAGAHVYSESDDALYVNKSYITIHAAKRAGNRTIRLPQSCDVYDALCGDRMYEQATELDLSLMPGQTLIFRYEPAQE